jgi:biopolymer transport protein TolQ
MGNESSMLELFWRADIVVKLVMLALALASVWTWGIIIEKVLLLRRMKARAAEFEDNFWGGRSLESLYERVAANADDPMSATFAAGMKEWKSGVKAATNPGELRTRLQGRIDRVMEIVIGREMAAAESRMVVLASVGAVAPFVGLFGTVWGIMHSFSAIAASNNTSLAVVAPGIAEALFATALGLLAAIPAVLAYNKFATDFGRFAERLDTFAGELSAILSRHMDEKAVA